MSLENQLHVRIKPHEWDALERRFYEVEGVDLSKETNSNRLRFLLGLKKVTPGAPGIVARRFKEWEGSSGWQGKREIRRPVSVRFPITIYEDEFCSIQEWVVGHRPLEKKESKPNVIRLALGLEPSERGSPILIAHRSKKSTE